MIPAWVQLAVALSAGASNDIRFCEVPSDCGKDQSCVGYVCASGSDRARVEVLYKIAVVPPFVASADPALAAEAERLYAMLIADLRASGFYEVVGREGLPLGWAVEGASPSEVRHTTWQADGFFRVVKIAMRRTPEGQSQVKIHAVEVERFGTVDLPEGDITVATDQIPRLSSRWVNALIGADTGVRGALGTRIVGTSEIAPGVKEIVVIGADGSGFRQVTQDKQLNLMPAWGPNGTIGWMSYASGNPDWIVDGKPFSNRPGLNAAGAWSPDGKLLALSVAESGDSEIVLLEADSGAEFARLTDDRSVDTSPAWSPDGKRLAFVSDRTSRPQIWIVSLTTGDIEQLTKDGYNTSPDWSPTGDSIVYIRQIGNNFQIMRYDFDTQITMRLTDGRKSAESPSYSPDGRYVAYAQKDENGTHLWIMNADGSGGARQVAGDRSFLAPDWE